MNADKLLQAIVARPDSDSRKGSELANDLLAEFQSGFPLDNLRQLLRSENDQLVKIGVWIASELGESGKPLLNDVSPLLNHPRKAVRFFALDCILLWASNSEKQALASAVNLVDDKEAAVRWKARGFLSRASLQQLQAALAFLRTTEPTSNNLKGLSWLVGPDAGKADLITKSLQSQEFSTRQYAVVAAARIAKDDPQPLSYASSLDDTELADFAGSFQKTL